MELGLRSNSKKNQLNNPGNDINTNENNLGYGANDDIDMLDNRNKINLNQIKMATPNLDDINEERKKVGLKPFSNTYCKICKQYNAHVPWLCPDYTCSICKSKGTHFANNCPKKPRLCQWCKNDLNPENYKNKENDLPHKDFQDCPYKNMIIAAKRIRCLFCKRYGHAARDCNYSSTNTYYNFNGYRRNYNYFKYNKRGNKRGGFRGAKRGGK